MHALKLLHNLLSSQCGLHSLRLTALLSGVENLLRGHRLSIAGLGRSARPGTRTKHQIKRMDRLAGNRHLHRERLSMYRAMARSLVGHLPRPVLLVDWSDARYDRSLQLLRASVVCEGRSVTIYEEIHPLSQFDNRRVRQRFLARLQSCLPADSRPIVVTDAGFRVSWYQQVEALGWDWVSRVRGRSLCRRADRDHWERVGELYPHATTKPRSLGKAILTRDNAHRCRLHIVRQRRKGRVKTTMYRTPAAGTHSLACAARQREPWLLATSLDCMTARQICALYRQRMQIEGTFRDLKNAQWGFRMRAHRTRCAERLNVLVLLATLATYVAWLAGVAATALGLQRQYQANTEKRRVLSTVYLGLQVLTHEPACLTKTSIIDAYEHLKATLHSPCAAS